MWSGRIRRSKGGEGKESLEKMFTAEARGVTQRIVLWFFGEARSVRMRWMIPMLLFVVLGAMTSVAQDGQVVGKDASSARMVREHEAPFLEVDDALVLPAWREYDHLMQDRCDSILLATSLALETSVTARDADYRIMTSDDRLAVFHMQLSLGEGGSEAGFAEMVARFLLQQGLQFGYQYARERVRASSLTEMDYLYLPQGPGVTRSFNEVGFEARMRGELQSRRVWRDYQEWKKNRIEPRE